MDTPKEMFCTAITQQPNLKLFSEDGIRVLKEIALNLIEDLTHEEVKRLLSRLPILNEFDQKETKKQITTLKKELRVVKVVTNILPNNFEYLIKTVLRFEGNTTRMVSYIDRGWAKSAWEKDQEPEDKGVGQVVWKKQEGLCSICGHNQLYCTCK